MYIIKELNGTRHKFATLEDVDKFLQSKNWFLLSNTAESSSLKNSDWNLDASSKDLKLDDGKDVYEFVDLILGEEKNYYGDRLSIKGYLYKKPCNDT